MRGVDFSPDVGLCRDKSKSLFCIMLDDESCEAGAKYAHPVKDYEIGVGQFGVWHRWLPHLASTTMLRDN